MTSRTRQTITRSVVLAAVAAAGVLALAGCKISVDNGSSAGGASPAPSAASAAPSASPANLPGTGKSASASARTSGKPSASASTKTGALPDPCTLLSRAEVSTGTGGKQIVQVDTDGKPAGDSTRYCQWQLSGARVVLSLSKATKAQFDTRGPDAKPVTGVAYDGFALAGHLYIYQRGLQVDIYASTGGTAATELQVEKAFAVKVLPRL